MTGYVGFPLCTWQCSHLHFSKIPRSCHWKHTTLHILTVLLNCFSKSRKGAEALFILATVQWVLQYEWELCNDTTSYWYSTDANSNAKQAKSQVHGRNVQSTVQCIFAVVLGSCPWFSSSDLQTADHGSYRLMDVISTPGEMTASVMKKKVSAYAAKHHLSQGVLLH